MNIFRKFGSKKNSTGVIGKSSDNDLHTRRLAELRPCEWPHNAFMEGARILQEFTQYVANAGLTDFITAECKQYHLLTNSFVQNFHFHSRNNPPEVSFNLYAKNRQIPLTEFCDICMLPSDGELVEPRPLEFDSFYRTLIVGDERSFEHHCHQLAVSYHALLCFIYRKVLASEREGGFTQRPGFCRFASPTLWRQHFQLGSYCGTSPSP